MSTKRYHKKSRAGCDTCKQRRVKCDEATPKCGRCTQRCEPCHYSRLRAITTTDRSTAGSTKAGPSTQSSPSPGHITFKSCPLFNAYNNPPTARLVSYNATRMKELQLMHQWSTVTYRNSGPRNMEVFRDYAVRKALEYPFLMDILLAFTCLHSASEAAEAADAYEHVTAALYFQNQSIAAINQGQSLISITQETCEPVVLVTAMNGVCTLLASMVPAASGEQLESVPEVMLRVRRCLLGMDEVIAQCHGWIANSELVRIFKSPTVGEIEEGGSLTADKVRALNDAVLANIDLDDSATPFFRSALQKIEKAYADNNGHSVFGWLAMIEADFFHKVASGNTAAVVILICWGALTYALEEVWWTRYAGKRIVEDMSIHLVGCDSKWNEVLQWCYDQVGIVRNS